MATDSILGTGNEPYVFGVICPAGTVKSKSKFSSPVIPDSSNAADKMSVKSWKRE